MISEVVERMNKINRELEFNPVHESIGNDSPLLKIVGVEPEVGPGNRSVDEVPSGRNEHSRPENNDTV